MTLKKYCLVALDMDGTITQHKTQLDTTNRRQLELLCKKYKVVIIGAGTCTRIENQLNFKGVDIVGSYGMQYSYYDRETNRNYIKKDIKINQVSQENIKDRVLKLRKKYGYEKYEGNSVEFHGSGMITIPLLGTKAIQEDKLKFDPDRKNRRKIYREVIQEFPEYEVFIGGSSSFDMVPKPYNKLYALKEYALEQEIPMNEIIYIGDDYGFGGNDECVFKSDISYITIERYTDFVEVTKELL